MGLEIVFLSFFGQKTSSFDASRRRLTHILFKNVRSMDGNLTEKYLKLGDDISVYDSNAEFGLRQIPAWSCM